MKYGSVICTVIFAVAVLLAVAQMWFSPLSAATFWKLQLTLGAFFILALAITLVVKEYLSEKKMKEDGYID